MGRKVQLRPARPKIAIVGDGETEKIYFSDIKDSDRPSDIDLYPALPARKGDFKKVLDTALVLSEEYTRVFALIDMDTVIRDGKGKEYAAARAAAETEGVIVLEMGPCFEIWLLLHFVQTTRSFTRCDEVVDEIRKPGRIPGYEKSQKWLVKAHLYANYKERLHLAIAAGKRLAKDRPADNPHYPRADIYEFFAWYIQPERLKLLQDGSVWPRSK